MPWPLRARSSGIRLPLFGKVHRHVRTRDLAISIKPSLAPSSEVGDRAKQDALDQKSTCKNAVDWNDCATRYAMTASLLKGMT